MLLKTIHCYIREEAWLAKMAARRLKTNQVAIVVGSTIFLHGVNAAEFMQKTTWLRHEVCHVRQYRKYTTIGFIFLYILESIRKGYYHNRFEQEARVAEQVAEGLSHTTFHITGKK